MYREGVVAVVTNHENKILLVNLVTQEPRFYVLPGGGIEGNESPESAILRELEEELGIRPNHLNIKRKAKTKLQYQARSGPIVRDGISYIGQSKTPFLIEFLGNDDDIHPAEDEVRSYIWAHYQQLNRYLLFTKEGQLSQVQQVISELYPEITQ